MPNLKSLKALKKLMQEEGLFRQAADNYVKGSINKRIIEKLDNPNLSLQERKAILRKEGRYDPYKIDPSTNDIINQRGGDIYEDPRKAAQETQKGADFFYPHHHEGAYEGWPIGIVDDGISSGSSSLERLSGVSGVDKDAAEKLRAVKNYPSKNLDENETFRGLVEHYKNYPGLTKMEEAPELWNRVLEAKTKEKFNKIKDQIKNKKSSK